MPLGAAAPGLVYGRASAFRLWCDTCRSGRQPGRNLELAEQPGSCGLGCFFISDRARSRFSIAHGWRPGSTSRSLARRQRSGVGLLSTRPSVRSGEYEAGASAVCGSGAAGDRGIVSGQLPPTLVCDKSGNWKFWCRISAGRSHCARRNHRLGEPDRSGCSSTLRLQSCYARPVGLVCLLYGQEFNRAMLHCGRNTELSGKLGGQRFVRNAFPGFARPSVFSDILHSFPRVP